MHVDPPSAFVPAREPPGEGRAARVLVVEDDRELREALADLLVLEGFEVEVERHGLDALIHLRTTPRLPDAVLLDLDMPVMNGWEFREVQLRDPLLAHIPVVVISSHAEEEPGDGALPKPCAPERLVERLRAAVRSSERGGAAAPR